MKRISLVVLIAFLFSGLYSQPNASLNPRGYAVDWYGNLMYYYWTLDYPSGFGNPVMIYKGEKFTSGYYFDVEGKKIEGKIQYSGFDGMNWYDAFVFDKDTVTSPATSHVKLREVRRISADSCLAYVVTGDSFFRFNNYSVKGMVGSREIDKYTFLRFIVKCGNIAFFGTDKGSGYLYKIDGNDSLYSLPMRDIELSNALVPLLKPYPCLYKKIKNASFNRKDIPQLIEFLRYAKAYEKQDKIPVDMFLCALNKQTTFGIFAKVDSLIETIAHISYYLPDGTRFCKGAINLLAAADHFKPQENFIKQIWNGTGKRIGEYIWYLKDGKPYKSIKYGKKEAYDVTHYYTNGKPQFVIHYKKGKFRYQEVYKMDGQSALDKNGTGELALYDSLENRQIVFNFKEFALDNAYYLDSHVNKIFVKSHGKVPSNRFVFIKSLVADSIGYPKEFALTGFQGVYFLKIRIQPNGYVSDVDVLCGFDQTNDSLVKQEVAAFFKNKKLYNTGKIGSEKIVQDYFVGFEHLMRNLNDFPKYQHDFRPPMPTYSYPTFR